MARYHRAQNLSQALDQLSNNPDDTIILAGGTTITPFLRPGDDDTVLLDVGRIPELQEMSCGSELVVGSAVTLSGFLGFVANQPSTPVTAMLGEVAAHIADPVMRNQATVGGNIARGGELASALLALDGEVIVESATRGRRRIRLTERLAHEDVALLGDPDELLTALVVENRSYNYTYYDKFTRSHLASIPLASIAAVQGAEIGDMRIVLGSHRLFPERMARLENRLAEHGASLPLSDAASAGRIIEEVLDDWLLPDDTFQGHIVRVLIERALCGIKPLHDALEVTRS